MRLVEILRTKAGALRVAEIAQLLGITPQHIYRLAASGAIPSFRVAGAGRFDPGEIASWRKRSKHALPPLREEGRDGLQHGARMGPTESLGPTLGRANHHDPNG